MTPEELQELQENANLYDSLSPTLKQIFVSQIGFGETIQNTSNASSHVGLLEEESKEMVKVEEGEMKFTDDPRTQRPFCPPSHFF